MDINKKYQRYKIDVLQYNASNQVFSNCADITFYNTGTNDATINNGLTLSPGQSIVFSANNDELDTTLYTISFQNNGKLNSLVVFRKIYV
jgi:hypothetical protein